MCPGNEEYEGSSANNEGISLKSEHSSPETFAQAGRGRRKTLLFISIDCDINSVILGKQFIRRANKNVESYY